MSSTTTPRTEHASVEGSSALGIRPYRPSDRTSLESMYEAYGPAERTLGTPPIGDERLDSWLDELLADGSHWVAAADRVVGHVSVIPISEDRAELSVYVHPSYFDRGIGTALTGHAVERSSGSYGTIWLLVERSNVRAIAVFESVGFEVVEYHRGELEMAYRTRED